jgi:hypothetical protein
MADDYTNTTATKGALSVAGQITGSLELPNDKDWFKITLQAGTTYVFDLLGANGGGGTLGAGSNEARLALFGSNGYSIDSAINNGTGGDPRLSFTPTTSGSYFLEASDLYDGTGTYTLKAAAASSPTPVAETHTLSVVVNAGVLAASAVWLKDLIEQISYVGDLVTSHKVIYGTSSFDYQTIDQLITTVTRDGDFTAEFRQEIADVNIAASSLSYGDVAALVGNPSISNVILYIAGVDGSYVS